MRIDSHLEEKYNTLLSVEAELLNKIAWYLWDVYPEMGSKVVEYSELCADNFWTVGLTSRGLYFDAYAIDSYREIAKELGVLCDQQIWEPIFVQDARFFEKIPFHVLRFLYENLIK